MEKGKRNKYTIKIPSETYARNIISGFLEKNSSYLERLICDCVHIINGRKIDANIVANMSFGEKVGWGERIKRAAKKMITPPKVLERVVTKGAEKRPESEQLDLFG